jgi:hypothetical protein
MAAVETCAENALHHHLHDIRKGWKDSQEKDQATNQRAYQAPAPAPVDPSLSQPVWSRSMPDSWRLFTQSILQTGLGAVPSTCKPSFSVVWPDSFGPGSSAVHPIRSLSTVDLFCPFSTTHTIQARWTVPAFSQMPLPSFAPSPRPSLVLSEPPMVLVGWDPAHQSGTQLRCFRKTLYLWWRTCRH